MSSPTPGSPKAILNEDALRKNGIWFESNIKDSPKLPSWLESVRQILTCRRTKLPFDAKDDFDIDHSEMDRSEIDSKCGWDLRPKDHDFENKKQRRKSCSKNDAESQVQLELDDCTKIRDEFKHLDKTATNEPGWQGALSKHIFTLCQNMDNGHGSIKKTLMRWELFEHVHWTELMQPCVRPQRVGLKFPKPDFTYGFPIIDPDDPVHKKYANHRSVKNFSIPVLHNLRKEKGLISSPGTALGRWKGTMGMLNAADLMCFPWAVVEVKPAGANPGAINYCYCQVANASAAALIFREELLQSASKKTDPNPDALVIFSFTCIGLDVRLWFTYRTEEKVIVKCVWATSLKLLWGVFALRMIIQNMCEWVNGDVRLELVTWIERARGFKPSEVFLYPSGSPVELSTPTTSSQAQSGSLQGNYLGLPKNPSAPQSKDLYDPFIGSRRQPSASKSGGLFKDYLASMRRPSPAQSRSLQGTPLDSTKRPNAPSHTSSTSKTSNRTSSTPKSSSHASNTSKNSSSTSKSPSSTSKNSSRASDPCRDTFVTKCTAPQQHEHDSTPEDDECESEDEDDKNDKDYHDDGHGNQDENNISPRITRSRKHTPSSTTSRPRHQPVVSHSKASSSPSPSPSPLETSAVRSRDNRAPSPEANLVRLRKNNDDAAESFASLSLSKGRRKS